MTKLQGCLIACALIASSASRGELVSVTTSNVNLAESKPFTRTTFNGKEFPQGLRTPFESRWISFTTELDTVADTARFTQTTFAYAPINTSVTTQIPGNFPTPPTEIIETIAFDPVSIVTPLASSESGVLRFREGTIYQTNFDYDLSFPDEFRLTGVYTVQGPTQRATVPFNARFLRGGFSPDQSRIGLFVDTGANFPASASVARASGIPSGAFYFATLATQTIFEGAIDGVMVNAQFTPNLSGSTNPRFAVQLWRNTDSLVPEPCGVTLAAIAVIALRVRARPS